MLCIGSRTVCTTRQAPSLKMHQSLDIFVVPPVPPPLFFRCSSPRDDNLESMAETQEAQISLGRQVQPFRCLLGIHPLFPADPIALPPSLALSARMCPECVAEALGTFFVVLFGYGSPLLPLGCLAGYQQTS